MAEHASVLYHLSPTKPFFLLLLFLLVVVIVAIRASRRLRLGDRFFSAFLNVSKHHNLEEETSHVLVRTALCFHFPFAPACWDIYPTASPNMTKTRIIPLMNLGRSVYT